MSTAHTITITGIRNGGDIQVPAPTPLDPDAVTTITLDNIVLTLDVGDTIQDHELHFNPAAIQNRQTNYGLADELAALESLARELVFRWDPSLTPIVSSDADTMKDSEVLAAAATYGITVPEFDGERNLTDSEKAAAARSTLSEQFTKIAQNGGLDNRIEVKWSDAARKQAITLLEELQ